MPMLEYCHCEPGYGTTDGYDSTCQLCAQGMFWAGEAGDTVFARTRGDGSTVAVAAVHMGLQPCSPCDVEHNERWTTLAEGARDQQDCVCSMG